MNFLEFDFLSLFEVSNLLAIVIGTFVGLLIGALPGLGATVAIVMLLPFTYGMEPLASVLMLVAAYQGAEYGGSISSIILGIPGTPAAAATLLDGNALSRQSSPGKALGYSLAASTVGGLFGGLVLLLLSVPLSAIALRMSDPEFFLIGIPGLGAGTSAWFSYSLAKRLSRTRESFGQGNPEGIAAPESANNATVGGAMLPLITLGIPGSPATAVILGAFIIHGITPGPSIFGTEKTLVYGIFYGFLLATVAMFLIGKLLTPLFARVLTTPNYILIPTVLLLALMGTYASNYLMFDLWVALGLGVVAFVMRKLDFSAAAFILAFVLSPIIEESLRRALLISDGSYAMFVTRGYSLTILLIIVMILGWSVYAYLGRRAGVQEAALGASE